MKEIDKVGVKSFGVFFPFPSGKTWMKNLNRPTDVFTFRFQYLHIHYVSEKRAGRREKWIINRPNECNIKALSRCLMELEMNSLRRK